MVEKKSDQNSSNDLNVENSGRSMKLDIPKDKLLELKLKSIALEELDSGVLISNDKGQIVWVNNSFCDIYGYTPDEIKNFNFGNIFSFGDVNTFFEGIKDTLKKNGVWESEVASRKKNGDKITVSQTILPVESTENLYSYYITVVNDVTTHKEIEKDLNNSVAREKALIKGIPDLVMKCYLNGYIISYHEREKEKLPIPKGDLTGKTITDCFPKEFSLRLLFFMEKALRSGEVQSFVFEHVGSDYDCYEEARITPVGEEEFIIMVRDITSRYKKDKDIKRYISKMERDAEALSIMSSKLQDSEQKLKELNINKDKFFSIIAHDLKNPFNSLLTFSDMLANQIDDLDQDEINDFSSRIFQSASSMYNLLENLLEWSRVQTERVEFYPKEFSIFFSIQEVINLYKMNAAKKNIIVTNKSNEDESVFADRNMINTVLRNLLSNAIKFTKDGGEIDFETTKKDGKLEVSIVDNGEGMSKELVSKLFRIEENVTKIGTNREKGTGLGLILVKEFITKNNGFIKVKSEEGKGSTFTFSLPTKG